MKTLSPPLPEGSRRPAAVALLTGGSDRPYVFGLGTALLAHGINLELVGSDELENLLPDVQGLTFLNLRGDNRPGPGLIAKVIRILRYYVRLIRYAATTRAKVLHILWNNKFETFDRTILMLYYKLLGKKIVFTAHNVNMRKRDSQDSALNRLTLCIQYRLADHLFVHTEKMKADLMDDFGAPAERITVIPFGMNNSLPNTSLTPGEAKRKLGLGGNRKTILFFGRITPYKGLDYLLAAFKELVKSDPGYFLIVAGRTDNCAAYWQALRPQIDTEARSGNALVWEGFIPDDEAEVYFKAADVLVMPYRDIYQSGVLFTGQHFGIPILAADVGSFSEDIVAGRNGWLFRPDDAHDLAKSIERYFQSDLYAELDDRRAQIRADAAKRHSWDTVAEMTVDIYKHMMKQVPRNKVADGSLGIEVPAGAGECRGEASQATR